MPLYVLAVVPSSHRLARRATVTIEDLAEVPLLVLRREFASRGWFDAAVEIAHLQPRVLLESGAPSALLALVRAGYGVAIVPSMVRIPAAGLRGIPLVQRGTPLGRWLGLAWDPRRVLPPYAERFIDELAEYCRRAPVNRFLRRAPSLPRPQES
jgi:DNA-binding transcriptional LysR family regulator